MSDWDQFGEPTNGAGYKSLEKAGDEIIGTLTRIGKASPFTDKDTGEPIVVPRLFMEENGEEFHYDATLVWLRNALLRERPEPGARLRLWRGSKKGQQVEAGVEILSGGSGPVTATVQNSGSKAKAADDLPPF